KETKDKIKEGTLKVDHGTGAMTVVLGKEKGGYARGVGSGVTYKSQLDNERRERQEKELLIQNLSNKVSKTEGMVSPVDISPIDSSADEEGGTPLSVVGCENDASIQKSNRLATSEKEMETRETVSSVGSKKTTKSLRKESSRQDSQSQENVSPLQVLPQITVLTTNMPYPSRKIRRICDQRPRRKQDPVCRIQRRPIRCIQVIEGEYSGRY
ncbi:hypothetical protein Tco_0831974, partial [Tanacetum coccineum]